MSYNHQMTILKVSKVCKSVPGHEETWFEMRLYDCLWLSSDRLRIVEPYGLYDSSEFIESSCFIELADILAHE